MDRPLSANPSPWQGGLRLHRVRLAACGKTQACSAGIVPVICEILHSHGDLISLIHYLFVLR
jgi:hypothetical protein